MEHPLFISHILSKTRSKTPSFTFPLTQVVFFLSDTQATRFWRCCPKTQPAASQTIGASATQEIEGTIPSSIPRTGSPAETIKANPLARTIQSSEACCTLGSEREFLKVIFFACTVVILTRSKKLLFGEVIYWISSEKEWYFFTSGVLNSAANERVFIFGFSPLWHRWFSSKSVPKRVARCLISALHWSPRPVLPGFGVLTEAGQWLNRWGERSTENNKKSPFQEKRSSSFKNSWKARDFSRNPWICRRAINRTQIHIDGALNKGDFFVQHVPQLQSEFRTLRRWTRVSFASLRLQRSRDDRVQPERQQERRVLPLQERQQRVGRRRRGLGQLQGRHGGGRGPRRGRRRVWEGTLGIQGGVHPLLRGILGKCPLLFRTFCSSLCQCCTT